MHAIADHVVDSYLDVTDLVETDIDAMEEDIFSPATHTNIECIYLLKREVVELRRAVNPFTLALQRIGTDHNDLISIEVRRYMRDVLDHNIQASDRITSYDEMLSSLVQAALGKVAMQQNVDMRKISAWVAIAAVPTALAGIYGMNFEHMPELQWTWGYPAVLMVMFCVCSCCTARSAATTGSSSARRRLSPRRIEYVHAVGPPRLTHRFGTLEPHPRRLGRGDRDGRQHDDRIDGAGQRDIADLAAAQQESGERGALPQRRAEVDQRIGSQHEPSTAGAAASTATLRASPAGEDPRSATVTSARGPRTGSAANSAGSVIGWREHPRDT